MTRKAPGRIRWAKGPQYSQTRVICLILMRSQREVGLHRDVRARDRGGYQVRSQWREGVYRHYRSAV